MNIGVYLAYNPNTTLKTEGLGRYLAGLIKGFLDENNNVILVMPKWMIDPVQDLLEEFDIDSSNIKFAYNKKTPIIWGVYNYLAKPKPHKKRGLKNKIADVIRKFKDFYIDLFAQTTNFIIFIFLCVIALIIALILGAVIIIAGIVLLPFFIAKLILKKNFKSAKGVYDRVLLLAKKVLRKKNDYVMYCFQKMMSSTRMSLVNTANEENVDIWFVSTLFWNETKHLNAPSVYVVPDVVVIDYPNAFAEDAAMTGVIEKCKDSIRNGTSFITYCEYVNESVLKKRFSKYNGIAIPHVNNALSRWISYKVGNKDYSEAFSRQLLERLPNRFIYDKDFFSNFTFKDVHYIFYASQARPYKNIFGLIKAYEELLRIDNIKHKLFLTCTPGTLSKDVQTYIEEHKLQYDILFFPGVDIQLLAALYKCADLVVNPTLYEGGFPFTFGEGMSVGTPSVMGNIPQTTEVLCKYNGLEDIMTFDPRDVESMRSKISWALNNLSELYEKELPLYNELSKRTSSLVAKEYIEVFKRVINQ